MVQKLIVISVIAPVAIAGILMLVTLAAISSTNQAFGETIRTQLGLGQYGVIGKPNQTTGTSDVKLYGYLLDAHTGVAISGATITFRGVEHGATTTDSHGEYLVHFSLAPGTYTVEAHYAGDSDHASASATRTITVTP